MDLSPRAKDLHAYEKSMKQPIEKPTKTMTTNEDDEDNEDNEDSEDNVGQDDLIPTTEAENC